LGKSLRTSIAGSLLLAAVTGCSSKLVSNVLPNLRPTVEFTDAPSSADPRDAYYYAYHVYWSGNDADGRVDHFAYAIDPTARETTWVTTKHNDEVIAFRATHADSVTGPLPTCSDFHVLVLEAVDNHGAVSARVTRAFYSYTIAPTVEILQPRPSHLLRLEVVPSFVVHWDGSDPDGDSPHKPVAYKTQLFSLDGPENQFILFDPDSLRRREAANHFAGWDSSGRDSTFRRISNLTPGSNWAFVVVAIDEAGAYSPVFSFDENVLQLSVSLADGLGPLLHVFNSLVDFTYDSGGYTADPGRWIRVEAPSGSDVDFNWNGIPHPGALIRDYRWAVDLASLSDPTPRRDEDADYFHWSRSSVLTTSCRLRGLANGEHFLYIEATENTGLQSLAVVQLNLVPLTGEKPLLVVDDTRYEVDRAGTDGCIAGYTTQWPSAAELDTFLFARGGVPWRCPAPGRGPTFSPPGILAGYAFDTLGTRQTPENPAATVLLSRLGHYRNIVWLVDARGAAYSASTGPLLITALRQTSAPGHASMLGAYVTAGGRVWLCGGGAANATLEDHNSGRNDDVTGRIYSFTAGELVPGRLLFDAAHWRSSLMVTAGTMSIARAARADFIAAHPWRQPDPRGGPDLVSPDYRKLPPELAWRDPETDPLPPTRSTSRASLYYRSGFPLEYIVTPNAIVEDVDPDPAIDRAASVLDTLFDSDSPTLKSHPGPCMTWYHGREANNFVFSGFAPWDYRRDDCMAIVDFVLHDIWGLERAPVDRSVRSDGLSRPGPTPAQRLTRAHATASR